MNQHTRALTYVFFASFLSLSISLLILNDHNNSIILSFIADRIGLGIFYIIFLSSGFFIISGILVFLNVLSGQKRGE
jgi:hypothetical protein